MIDPIAFQMGNFTIKWYGVMHAIAVFAAYLTLKHLSLRKGKSKVEVLEATIYVVIGLYIGSKLFHLLIYNPINFFNDPLIFFSRNGLSSHGGFIGGTLGLLYYCKKNNQEFWSWADKVMVGVAITGFFVRLGNFINQELVGTITNLPWGIKFDDYQEKRHPVQIYESLKDLFLFAFLMKLSYLDKLKLPKGFIYWSYLFLYSIFRFFIEFTKEYLIYEQGLTMGQRISLGLSIVSGTILIWLWIKKREK